MKLINSIPVWGDPIDPDALKQIQTCARTADYAAMMADHHKGYAVPIGGVVAYEDKVSPSGVGYDIGCIASGTPITTEDGYSLPIDDVREWHPATCWDSETVRRIEGNWGRVFRGLKSVLSLQLANGRTLRATDDHQVLTREGWQEAGRLQIGAKVACSPFVGVPYAAYPSPIEVELHHPGHIEVLQTRGLYPLVVDSPRFPALIRLLAYICGDGHLHTNGSRISIWTTNDRDAYDLRRDFEILGFLAREARRTRKAGYKAEIHIYLNAPALHALFAALGAPVGKKEWQAEPMPWLFRLPAWVRAHFLSAFCSAEMMAPVLVAQRHQNLQVKQAGENDHAIQFISRLAQSLGFETSVAQSGPKRGPRQDYVMQILGGEAAQLRFLEQVGFCRAYDKRVRAAQTVSIAWQARSLAQHREGAHQEARRLHEVGVYFKTAIATVMEQFDVSHSFAFHAYYDRGPSRRPLHALFTPDTHGEICWVPVTQISQGEPEYVYDIATSDEAHCFFANGIVVHNCGNKAVLTDIPATEVRRNIQRIMDDIWTTLSFGMGRKNNVRVDHPLFEDPAWTLKPMRELKTVAQQQLGTIGSGNHYVDLFEDEQGRAWIGVHFGSRGLGHKTATYFLEQGGAKDGMDVEPLVLPVATSLGTDYLECMRLAGRYAYAGRDWVCDQVAKLLGATILEEVHNHHNYCIPGHEIIPTPNGPKRMGDIQAGDIVYAWDRDCGAVPTQVLKKWQTGEKPIYRIRTDSREICVSGDHPILTIVVEDYPHPERPWHNKKVGRYCWKQAKELVKDDILVCVHGYYSSNEAKSIGADLARLVGAFLGDGWVRHETARQGYSVGLAIGAADEPHTARYLSLVKNALPTATWNNNVPGAFGLTCSSRDVWRRLNELGLTGYSYEKRVPDFAYTLPRPEKLALLSGYFDSDGSVAGDDPRNHGRGTIASTNRELVEGLRELALSCELHITPVNVETRLTNFGPSTVYRCTIRPNSMVQLDLWHEAKKANTRSTPRESFALASDKIGYLELPPATVAQKVRQITVSEPEVVYDLTVEHPDHTFICAGIVVHNCWRERHDNQDLWVVRKGATPAFPGQRGFVGGSMGDKAVIIEGVDSEESRLALYSTVHGAGRVMSRTAARGKVNRRGQVLKPGAISRAMMLAWLKEQRVELRGAGTDESPHCYKRLPDVLAQHGNTIRILHTLTPIGVAMAGEDEFDPYKD